MILAINTAQRIHELALIDGDELLAEEIWQANKDDVDRLVPSLEKMLLSLDLPKEDITEILVIRGPGSFTAVRTGVVFANALAEGLNAKLYTLNTFDCLHRKAASADPTIAVLHAGGLDVGVSYKGEIKIGPITNLLADIPHGSFKVIAEVTETQNDELHSIILEKGWQQVKGHALQTLGEMLLTSGLIGLKQVQTVDAMYMKSPVITKSSNPWKQ